MNKSIIFCLGAVFGAGVGSAATYFIAKDYYEEREIRRLDEYAEHCDEKIERIMLEAKGLNKLEEEFDQPEEEPLTDDPNEDAINRNEGVKKYHHNDGISSKYGENNIFGKTEKKDIQVQQRLIDGITEEEFLEQEGNEKQTLDIFLGDDEYIAAIWGYETDNEEDAEKRFGKPLSEIIGKENADYDNLLSLIDPNEGIGQLYLRNNSLMMDVEIVIHDNREEDTRDGIE